MSKEKCFVSAVIYVHNVEKEIGNLLAKLIRVFEENFDHSEIICVNDFSSDESVRVIKELASNAETTMVSILNMSYYHGLEVSMNAGMDLAIGDFVIEFDSSTMDYESDEIMKAYYMVQQGYDIVSASAQKKQRISSRIFYWLYKKFSSDGLQMRSETFRILSRRAINRINSASKTIPYRKGVYSSCGLKMNNFEYKLVEKNFLHSRTKMASKYRHELAVDTLLLFTDAGYFFGKIMIEIMSIISLLMIVYTVVVYIMSKPVEGWTTTILFLSVAFFGLFTILTIIVKYLQMLLRLSFKRTKYNFDSVEKLTK